MKRSRTSSTVLTAVASVAALALGAVGPGSTAAAAPDQRPGQAPQAQETQAPLRYVALGDSYSAATGVLPPVPTAPPQCLRSARNYPHLIAGATGASLTDVTCGAADTTHYRNAQYDNVPPQLDALSRDTQLVTMTIGGNDGGVFIDSIVNCGVEGVRTAGRGSPCKDRYGSTFVDSVRQKTFPAVVRALRDVHRRSPDAEVAILTYPWILPRTVGCFDKMPIARGDVPYLRNIQRVLNDAVRRAAARTGSTFVNLNGVSDGHDACQPIGTRWIEPVLQGTNPVIVHPNAFGERRMAQRTMRVLGLR